MADKNYTGNQDTRRRLKDFGSTGEVSIFGDVVGVVGDEDVFDLTLSLDTSAYAAGDVLAATQELTNFFVTRTSSRVVQSITVLDEDDNAGDFDIVFLNANSSIGTENAAVSVSDADARTIIGAVEITAADYIDLVNSQLAVKTGIGLVLKGGGVSTSVWVAAISRGTKTYTASGLRLKIGVL